MNTGKFYAFLESLITPENKVLVESVAAGFMVCFESEIEITTKDDGKLPPIFTPNDIDTTDPLWKSKVVNYVLQMLNQPGKLLRESEYRIVVHPNALVVVDRQHTLNLVDYPQWVEFRDQWMQSHPEEVEALKKRAKFHHSVKTIDAERWVDKNGRSAAGKGKDFANMSMGDMAKRAEEAKAKRETDKFSELNKKLFR